MIGPGHYGYNISKKWRNREAMNDIIGRYIEICRNWEQCWVKDLQ
jgi:hypothetical protein